MKSLCLTLLNFLIFNVFVLAQHNKTGCISGNCENGTGKYLFASGDIYVIPIIIAVFIGRIGCFLSGIAEPTFGIETTFFMGMNLGDGKLRHPVALYEMIYMVFLFALFYKLKSKSLDNGERFKLFMVLYFLYRFAVEFIKPYHPIFLHLSSIQWSSIFIFVYYWKFMIRTFKTLFS